MAETKLTDKMRGAIRMNTRSAIIEEEINDCIDACKRDLYESGVNNINEDDALIIRAIKLFVKAEFGLDSNSLRFKESYELLKMSLALAGDYNQKNKE